VLQAVEEVVTGLQVTLVVLAVGHTMTKMLHELALLVT